VVREVQIPNFEMANPEAEVVRRKEGSGIVLANFLVLDVVTYSPPNLTMGNLFPTPLVESRNFVTLTCSADSPHPPYSGSAKTQGERRAMAPP
jgi:hypothetical protein